jgi:hypothetical protein
MHRHVCALPLIAYQLSWSLLYACFTSEGILLVDTWTGRAQQVEEMRANETGIATTLSL